MSKTAQPVGSLWNRFAAFKNAKDGGVVVDRGQLHQSSGYKRQVAALLLLSKQTPRKKEPA